MAAEDLVDVSDDAFFLDPWSKAGQVMAAKWRGKILAARLHAERALEMLQAVEATEPDLRQKNALIAMGLGAGRIDFIGLKVQFSDEMTTAYAKAYALPDDKNHQIEARELLYSITSMNGRCQVLRDGYSMLKNLYRENCCGRTAPSGWTTCLSATTCAYSSGKSVARS